MYIIIDEVSALLVLLEKEFIPHDDNYHITMSLINRMITYRDDHVPS